MPSLIDRAKRWYRRNQEHLYCWAIVTLTDDEGYIFSAVYPLQQPIHLDDLENMVLDAVDDGVIQPCHLAVGFRRVVPAQAISVWIDQRRSIMEHPQAMGEVIVVQDPEED